MTPLMHPGVRLLRLFGALVGSLSIVGLSLVTLSVTITQNGNLWVCAGLLGAALWTATTGLLWAITPALPVPLRIFTHCPRCGALHVDEGVWATRLHRTHRCAQCGREWRPAAVPTVGVDALE